MSTIPLHPKVTEFLSLNPIPSFIGGEFVAGPASSDVIDPATGSAVARVSMAGPSEVDAAVKAADKAFGPWSRLSAGDRSAILHRLADSIEREAEVLAQLEALDVGKPVVNARGFDIPFGAECIRYFADHAAEAVRDIPLDVKGIEARVHRTPYGVCGFIFPWNFPFTILCWGIGPALAAGNTVVVKASEVTPLTSLYLANLAIEAGIPAGVINVYTGLGSVAGQPLAEHPLLRRMSFTGSSAVGRKIGGICGERLVPCKLELGGKGAAIVLDDADVETAAEKLAGAITLNTGQVCCTATRWFLHESIYDRFVKRVREVLEATKIGHGLREETQMGPLVSGVQRDRVREYYRKGLAEGATPVVELADPGVGEGFFVTPHLLAGSDDNICFREEVFGPTAFLVKFSSDDEAVDRVNHIPYGLANSVWGTDLARVNRIAERLVAGNCWINAHNVFAYGLPYGGVNLSGIGGGVNSPETFLDYLRSQTIARPL